MPRQERLDILEHCCRRSIGHNLLQGLLMLFRHAVPQYRPEALCSPVVGKAQGFIPRKTTHAFPTSTFKAGLQTMKIHTQITKGGPSEILLEPTCANLGTSLRSFVKPPFKEKMRRISGTEAADALRSQPSPEANLVHPPRLLIGTAISALERVSLELAKWLTHHVKTQFKLRKNMSAGQPPHSAYA